MIEWSRRREIISKVRVGPLRGEDVDGGLVVKELVVGHAMGDLLCGNQHACTKCKEQGRNKKDKGAAGHRL